jgi:hypothetical protein
MMHSLTCYNTSHAYNKDYAIKIHRNVMYCTGAMSNVSILETSVLTGEVWLTPCSPSFPTSSNASAQTASINLN